jgi:D-amino peptidase
MKIYIMTDMEGACGVLNFADWESSAGIYYELGKKLLTMEVNAAVEGFFEAGADEIYVADGHGYGGINHELLDNRTYYIKGFADRWPCLLDKSFDAVAFVGQHAKAGTEFAHLPHTQSLSYLDCKINGISVGEFGQFAACASFLGIRTIFASGDKAFAAEARDLMEGIETVWVKEGTTPGKGDECSREEYSVRNLSAVHIHPEKARILIKDGAERALSRFIKDRESFKLFELKPPYKCRIDYRRSAKNLPYTVCSEHPDDVIELINGTDITQWQNVTKEI